MNIFIASVKNNVGLLTSEESWHCAKVLRNKMGDTIRLIDGIGNFYDGVLDIVSEKQCVVNITSGPTAQAAKNYILHLAIAPTKQIDRVEWMLEKAVEIGIDEISFLGCKNSERTVIKSDRIKKIVESAVKQSLQAFIPKVNELKPFKDFVKETACTQKYIAHCFEETKKSIKTINFKNQSTLILIGPEGDFTKDEVQFAIQHSYETISLGDTRLRSETAGLYVCQAASLLS